VPLLNLLFLLLNTVDIRQHIVVQEMTNQVPGLLIFTHNRHWLVLWFCLI